MLHNSQIDFRSPSQFWIWHRVSWTDLALKEARIVSSFPKAWFGSGFLKARIGSGFLKAQIVSGFPKARIGSGFPKARIIILKSIFNEGNPQNYFEL